MDMVKEEVSKGVMLDGAQMGLSMVMAGTIGFLKKHKMPIEDWARYIGESFEGAMGDLEGAPLSTVMEHLLTLEVLPMGVQVVSSESTSRKAEVTLTTLPSRDILKKFGTTPSEFLSGFGITKQDMSFVYTMYEAAANAIGLQFNHELTDNHQVLSLKRASVSGVRVRS
jgi:hypothetical protein